jgi:phosphatidylserine decarboxylase
MTGTLVAIAIFLVAFASWRFLFFFRNPNRPIAVDSRMILSPADGFIIYIRRVEPGQEVIAMKKGEPILLDDLMTIDDPSIPRHGWLVGIYMSPLDVHYNRAPIAGHIRKISHGFPQKSRGRNSGMFPVQSNLFFDLRPFWQDCDHLVHNERASYIISNETLSVYVTQIADRWVRKIVTYKNCVSIGQGEIFGLIRMGSQVDVFVPDPQGTMEVLATERRHVRAGIHPLFQVKEIGSVLLGR